MNLIQVGLLSGAAVPFLLATWAAFMHRHLASLGNARTGFPPSDPRPAGAPPQDRDFPDHAPDGADETAHFVPPPARFKAEAVEIAPLARAVAEELEPTARALCTRMGLAIDPVLAVRIDRATLRAALRETMRTALRSTPDGRILVSAVPLGGRMDLHVTDDGAEANQRTREALAREPGAWIALQGGSIAVLARPGRGTTVTLRLPMPIAPVVAPAAKPSETDASAAADDNRARETTAT